MTTPPLAEVIASPDYGVISRSIADTIAKCTKPLTDTQRAVLAPSLAVWCEKLIADALRASAASLRDEGLPDDVRWALQIADIALSQSTADVGGRWSETGSPRFELRALLAPTQPAAQERQA